MLGFVSREKKAEGRCFTLSRVWYLRGTQRQFPPKYIENTFWAMQSTFRCLEMHFIILGELESFRNYKGLKLQNFRY